MFIRWVSEQNIDEEIQILFDLKGIYYYTFVRGVPHPEFVISQVFFLNTVKNLI